MQVSLNQPFACLTSARILACVSIFADACMKAPPV